MWSENYRFALRERWESLRRWIVISAAALAFSLGVGPAAGGDIHDATGAGDVPKVKELLAKNPALVNDREEDGSTPLHVAARLGQQELVQLLLAAKADPSATNLFGLTPLQMARVRAKDKIVEMLLAANVSERDRFNVLRDALHEAIAKGYYEKATQILETNPPSLDLLHSKDNLANQPIHVACFTGNTNFVKYLLEKGASATATNLEGNTPLHAAALMGRAELVELLLAAGAPVDPLSLAEITPLQLACDRGHLAVALRLVEHKADVNHRTKIGITALIAAANRREMEVAKMLLDHGADVNIRGDKNATPLHFAIRNEDLPFVELLLAYKADVTIKTIEGQTPLGLCIQRGLVSIAQALKKAGAKE